MANQSAERFVKQLVAFCCRRFKPDAYQVEAYKQKLSRWYLTEDEWARAMSKITADYSEEGLPPLPLIYTVLKSCQHEQIPSDPAMLTFRKGGLFYVLAEPDPGARPDVINKLKVKAIDPQCPPTAPEGCEDSRVILPPDKQAPFERVSQEEARECFRKGFLEAGGKPADPEKYWQAVTKPAEPDRKPVWWQDEPDESELPI